MKVVRKQVSIIIAIAACYLLLTACGESKVAQCNKLIQVVNQGNALIDSKKDNSDVGSIKNLANALNQTAKDLDTLELTETNLKGFQSRLSAEFRELGKSLIDMAKNAPTTSEGREQVEKAKRDVTKAGQAANKAAKNQDNLTGELAVYCSK